MKDFFDNFARLSGARPELVEKDYILHRILTALAKRTDISERLLFKGGTCLARAYGDYYRFSEDLDFTWADQSIWKDRTMQKAKKACSIEIDRLAGVLTEVSNDTGMVFSGDKADKGHVKISSGGRMVVFHLAYESEVLRTDQKVKLEVNFVEDIVYPSILRPVPGLAHKSSSGNARSFHPETWAEYVSLPSWNCYDPREILVEKCRAALTRKVNKWRDIVDICYIEDVLGHRLVDHRDVIGRKVRFMTDLYKRYDENIS
ncbi:MAG: nucleotidyl transferase AbiEii/AbiGii toxin family protein, partial [Thermoplasmata archaeon]|nr:nucleotidyl transferase AbiEii/AbiGii toxin family protein [Thermoplasmata archaeon]